MSKLIDAKKVAWIAPETLDKNVGEYRELTATEIVGADEKSGWPGHEVAVWGDLVVWVDDAPDDNKDGSGHFERYSGPEDEYTPQVRGDL